MSGIVCIFHTDGSPTDPETIKAMTQAMAYRGPDGITQWHEGAIALGHCQMHTTTESLEERQPLSNEAGSVVLAMDGYIANYDELRADLLARGARLRDRSDAELVLHAYETWREDCPRHIDGEYAFVIWDARRREVFCARDHQGLRPLVYWFDGARLLVASDIAAIVAGLGGMPPVNRGYTAEFMANVWYSNDETVWEGILRLPPAHTMRVGHDGRVLNRYWSLPLEVSIRYRSDGEYFEHYRAMFADCVRRASRSATTVAFEVSGGLDSSALFCMADQLLSQGRLPAPDIAGYTLDTEPGSLADEMAFVQAVERQTNRNIARVPIFAPDLQWSLQQAQKDCDFPLFPNTFMLIGMAEQLAAGGSRVALNGQGGDVWLNGSPAYYREELATLDLSNLARSLREDIAALGIGKAWSLLLRLGMFALLPEPVKVVARAFRPAKVLDPLATNFWLSEEMRGELAQRQARYSSAQAKFPPHLRYKVEKLEFPFHALVSEMVSRVSAQAGVEHRAPFLSRQFIEFSCTTPEWTRLRGGVRKHIHRQALSGILPAEIAQRNSKAFFDSTFKKYESQVRQFCLQPGPPVFESMIDRPGLARFMDSYCNAAIDDGAIWEIWGNYVGAVLTRMPYQCD
jgi:asparagine synthase (glutamine-hydrolysing)